MSKARETATETGSTPWSNARLGTEKAKLADTLRLAAVAFTDLADTPKVNDATQAQIEALTALVDEFHQWKEAVEGGP
jgi:hypothetical protein